MKMINIGKMMKISLVRIFNRLKKYINIKYKQ